MEVQFIGKLRQQPFRMALQKAAKLLVIPDNLTVYVLSHQKHCAELAKQFSKPTAKQFQHVCSTGKVTFSFNHKRRNVIVVYLTRENKFLLTNQQALLGLLLHELIHLMQMQKGVYKCLQTSFATVYPKYLGKVKKLKVKGAVPVFYNIGQASLLLLKDLYGNSTLLERGYGKYLYAYYAEEFKLKKTCPKPVFYDKLKEAIKKDATLLHTVFSFEFALLSVLLPFQKYEKTKASKLIKHIEHCYQLNVKEVSRKCRDLVTFYAKEYKQPSRAFEKKYLHFIFQKVSGLLQ